MNEIPTSDQSSSVVEPVEPIATPWPLAAHLAVVGRQIQPDDGSTNVPSSDDEVNGLTTWTDDF